MSGSRTVRSTISCSFIARLRRGCRPFALWLVHPLASRDRAGVHDAPRLGIERVAPMQHGKIVPHQEVADLPLMGQREARLRRVSPERIQQGFALGDLEANDVGIWPPAEKQRFAPRSGLGPDQ